MGNKNQVFQFKTNINCSGCVAAVAPHLNNAEGIENWTVDTSNKDKILTVQFVGISEEQVIDAVQKAGYKIESLNK